jgi:DNA polymerase sigma
MKLPIQAQLLELFLMNIRLNLDVQLELFGSSLSGFGFKTSDVNMNIDLNKCRDMGLTQSEQAALISKLGQTLDNLPNIE